jgi:hypothetical protein
MKYYSGESPANPVTFITWRGDLPSSPPTDFNSAFLSGKMIDYLQNDVKVRELSDYMLVFDFRELPLSDLVEIVVTEDRYAFAPETFNSLMKSSPTILNPFTKKPFSLKSLVKYSYGYTGIFTVGPFKGFLNEAPSRDQIYVAEGKIIYEQEPYISLESEVLERFGQPEIAARTQTNSDRIIFDNSTKVASPNTVMKATFNDAQNPTNLSLNSIQEKYFMRFYVDLANDVLMELFKLLVGSDIYTTRRITMESVETKSLTNDEKLFLNIEKMWRKGYFLTDWSVLYLKRTGRMSLARLLIPDPIKESESITESRNSIRFIESLVE